MAPQDIAEIVEAARDHNERHDITGLLLFNGINFLQTLEGEAKIVEHLMDRIAADARHSGVVVIAKETVDERAFDGWSMAYVRLGPNGGAIGDGEGRLDFDIPDGGLDKAEIGARLNALAAREAEVSERWITDEELDANPGLVKTMSVKPPRGSGRVRLVAIGDIDLQPCGGTHVRNTAEIGAVAVTDIEKKGKQNRRVRIALA